METLDLIISSTDKSFFEWAANDFNCKVTFTDNRAFLEGSSMTELFRVAFMAGYYKANEMHKTLNK